MNISSLNLPNGGNTILEIPRELLENPNYDGQSAAKPLKEDSDYWILENGKLFSLKSKRFLAGKIDNIGYQVYSVQIINPMTGKRGKMMYAHRLVAEYFIPNDNPEKKTYVHHKDENKLNNNVDNLEWVTPQQNCHEHLKKKGQIVRSVPVFKDKDLPDEEWRDIIEEPNYQISSYGRVLNKKTNRILKWDEHQRYTRVSLGLKKKHYYIHRLVYCTFHNDYDLEGYVIDHIDCNPRNNHLSNLQKLTHSENNKRRFD